VVENEGCFGIRAVATTHALETINHAFVLASSLIDRFVIAVTGAAGGGRSIECIAFWIDQNARTAMPLTAFQKQSKERWEEGSGPVSTSTVSL
jgi:hypothetical protein